MSGIEQLLKIARRYAELRDVPLSTVSSRVFDDGKKLGALESGADINVKRLEKALGWFSENLSAEEWPTDVPRPCCLADEARP